MGSNFPIFFGSFNNVSGKLNLAQFKPGAIATERIPSLPSPRDITMPSLNLKTPFLL